MTVHHLTPFSLSKNLGQAYNLAMSMIPDGDAACLRDMDTMFLTPDAGQIIQYYAEKNPDKVLTCYTNRIHPYAKEQLLLGTPLNDRDILQHVKLAKEQKRDRVGLTKCTGPLSFLLQVIPKSVWQKVPFREDIGLLGVDTIWFKDLKSAGVGIYRIDQLHIWHTYRLGQDIKDTTHLA